MRNKKDKYRQRKVKTDVAVRHVTPVGMNIFLELGFPSEEAEKYL